MSAPMRHRLFHAIVMVGASLPMACGSDDPSTTPAVDSGSSSSDALLTSDSTAADSAVADSTSADTTVVDTGKPDTGTMVDAAEDVCDGGCGSSCFPCIK